MGKMPRFTAAPTGSAGSGQTRASDIGLLSQTGGVTEARALQGLGRDVQQASATGAKVLDRKLEVDAKLQTDMTTSNSNMEAKKMYDAAGEREVQSETNRDLFTKEDVATFSKYLDEQISSTDQRAKDTLAPWREKAIKEFEYNIGKVYKGRWAEFTEVETIGLAQADVVAGDLPSGLAKIDWLLKEGIIREKRVAAINAGLVELHKTSSVDQTKPSIEEVLEENDFALKPANEAIDTLVGGLVKEGILDDVEASEARKQLSNWAADVAAQRRRNEKQNVVQTYQEFSDKIVKGQFTRDDVALSNLNQNQKKPWEPILQGMRKGSSTKTTFTGSKKVVDTLTELASGKIGEIDALLDINNARFVDQAITDDQYELAIGRVKNKYPDDVAKTINGALESAEGVLSQGGRGIFFGFDFLDLGEKNKLADVRMGLLSYIETESQDGTYPTGEEIYKKVRELGVSIETPASVIPEPPKPIPEKTDMLYDPSDAEVDAMPSGTEWYDPVTSAWWTRE